MTELKIGDEGKTDSSIWTTYKIVAEHADGRLICELMSTAGVPHLCTIKDPDMAAGIKLLPPTPKVQTLRRWLCVGGFDGPKLLTTDVKFSLVDRPADITYGPDGRIVSITFADEAADEPKLLDLRVGDVVRLRNGDEDRIERIESVGQPVIGMRHCWWKDGRYNLAGGEAPYDIVAVVKRVE